MRDEGYSFSSFRGIETGPGYASATRGIQYVDLVHQIDADEFGLDVSFAKGPTTASTNGFVSLSGGSGLRTSYTAGVGNANSVFNITIEFKGTWTSTLQNHFVTAANQLTSLIIGDLPSVRVSSGGAIRTVDDIVIVAELKAIDGVGGVLGQAGPTAIRTTSHLPATAIMQFDSADASRYGATFGDIVLHEMGHSLGFGSLWSYYGGLVTNGLYHGARAVAEYVEMGGSAAGIPVETGGGRGTAGSHWSESAFDRELMTGYIDSRNYFTDMSAAAFADLGYTVARSFGPIIDTGYTFPS